MKKHIDKSKLAVRIMCIFLCVLMVLGSVVTVINLLTM